MAFLLIFVLACLLSHLSAEEAMTLEFQGTTVFGRQSMNLQSSRIEAKTNPVAAPTRRAQTSGTEPATQTLGHILIEQLCTQ